MAGSRQILRQRFGVPVDNFCYPSGRYDDTVISAVRRAGYVGAADRDPRGRGRGPSLHPRSDRDPARRTGCRASSRSSGPLGPASVRWRERDGVKWLEAELPGARAAFSTRLGGRQRSAPFESLNLGRLTGDRTSGAREPAPAGCRRRDRSGARPDRPPGPRRRGGPASKDRRAPALSPNPAPGCRRPTAMSPRVTGLAPAGPRRRLPAGGARGIGRRGDDPLRLARAGGGDRRARGGGGPPRGRRRSAPASAPAATRSGDEVLAAFARARPRRSQRAGCSTCADGRAAPARAGGVESIEVCGALHELPAGALLLAPPRRRPHGQPGRPRLDQRREAA